MKTIRSLFILLFLGTASLARATDFTDLWWNANENGWGVNIAHQDTILFMTFFLYGPNNQAIWYSASSVNFQGSDTLGNLTYTGKLFQTTGPWFGTSPYVASTVAVTEVGSVTFIAKTANAASLTYTVNGVSVSKEISRLTFRSNPLLNGSFIGGFAGDVTNCGSSNGHFEVGALIAVSGINSSQQIVISPSQGTCTISGPYVATGRLGQLSGSITCGSSTGTATVFEIDANSFSISAGYQATYSDGCRELGRFGGVRR